MRVIIHKAAATGDRQTDNLLIEANVEFPSFSGETSCLDASILHQRNADSLGEAIVKTLPGGTIDRLLIFLLEHRASVLRVAHQQVQH